MCEFPAENPEIECLALNSFALYQCALLQMVTELQAPTADVRVNQAFPTNESSLHFTYSLQAKYSFPFP